jgi:hypothetical protein
MILNNVWNKWSYISGKVKSVLGHLIFKLRIVRSIYTEKNSLAIMLVYAGTVVFYFQFSYRLYCNRSFSCPDIESLQLPYTYCTEKLFSSLNESAKDLLKQLDFKYMPPSTVHWLIVKRMSKFLLMYQILERGSFYAVGRIELWFLYVEWLRGNIQALMMLIKNYLNIHLLVT